MGGELKEYNKKRDFDRTFEPQGEIIKTGGGLRFVVQHHMARSNHYDLRLEWSGVLLSWAVPKGPSYNTKDRRLAAKVEDHPIEYRNFEGTIPKGEYGGGTVMIWDEGYWEPYANSNVSECLNKGELKFILKGRRLKGKWVLVRWKAKSSGAKDNWLLIKERDEFAADRAGIEEFTTSIRTDRTMKGIEEGEDEKIQVNPFDSAPVQLAKQVSEIPGYGDWIFELKYDGYRIIAYIEGNSVRLVTRNGNDYTKRFNEIMRSLLDLASGRAMVLDGEIAMVDEHGKTDFHGLQNYMRSPNKGSLTYIIFDILALDGEDLRGNTLIQRKEMLEELMMNSPGNLYFSRHVEGSGTESFEAACSGGMEGIVGKKTDSIYSGARNGDWIKLKCDNRQEFIIGGYTLSDKRDWGVSSLLLGVYEDEDLIYVGRAGTGISEADMKELDSKFQGIKRRNSPFSIEPKKGRNEKIVWLDPKLIAEIKFAEWTDKNLLRHANYKGLRIDKSPKSVAKESAVAMTMKGTEQKVGLAKELVIEGIKITNPDKVIFGDHDSPEITKADVAMYYKAAAERMLPYAGYRILSIIRCPKGISQTCFFKKHPGKGDRDIRRINILNSEGLMKEYLYIEDISGLIYEAQMGTLEFHTWNSKVNAVETPDIIVFDLDPDVGMDITEVRRGATDLRTILTELSLTSYLKTSGGKGYHIIVPLRPPSSWDAVYSFAKQVAKVMEQKWPNRYTSNMRKVDRKGKIFIDWIRNGRGATSIAPYSLRARKGAPVSMPIFWEELNSVAPDGIDMKEALRRIPGDDPWKGFFTVEQMLK